MYNKSRTHIKISTDRKLVLLEWPRLAVSGGELGGVEVVPLH